MFGNNLWLVSVVGFLAICTTGMKMQARPAIVLDGPLRVAVTEDHPWVIIKEDCGGDTKPILNETCVTGFLIDLLDKIKDELKFTTTYTQFNSKGVYDASNKNFTELLGSVAANETDVGLSPIKIVEDHKTLLDYTVPFYKTMQNVSYALVFPKGSQLKSSFSHMIQKLQNQRHLEQFKEVWFIEGKDLWSADKQISPL